MTGRFRNASLVVVAVAAVGATGALANNLPLLTGNNPSSASPVVQGSSTTKDHSSAPGVTTSPKIVESPEASAKPEPSQVPEVKDTPKVEATEKPEIEKDAHGDCVSKAARDKSTEGKDHGQSTSKAAHDCPGGDAKSGDQTDTQKDTESKD
ncbi:MAG: hypothetical protein ACYDGR_08500 [Candidatus Dormibacteria bacterium]